MATRREELCRVQHRFACNRIAVLLLAAFSLAQCGFFCGADCGSLPLQRRIARANQGSNARVWRRQRLRLCQQRERGLVLLRLAGLANEFGNGCLAFTRLFLSSSRFFLLSPPRFFLSSGCFLLPYLFEASGLFLPPPGVLPLLLFETSRLLFSSLFFEVLALERRGALRNLRVDTRVTR